MSGRIHCARSPGRWRFALAAALGACAVEQPGIDPPEAGFYFPTGLAIDPDGRYLYVTNANSDLRYNAGTAMAVDLARLPDLGALSGAICPCEDDPTEPIADACDEACVVADSVRVGNFANDVRLHRGDGLDRLYLTVRSDPRALVWVDVDPSAGERALECGQQRLDSNRCDAGHTVESIEPDEDLGGEERTLPAEPYGIWLEEAPDLAPRLFVTHLADGEVTVFDDCGDEVRALHSSAELFPADSQGRRGAFTILPRDPASPGGLFYVTSRVSNQIATVRVDPAAERCDPATRVVPVSSFSLGGLFDGSDARGLAFAPGGDRAFVADREPPSLVEIDTSMEDGAPRNRPTRSVEVCPEPSIVRLEPRSDRTLLWVVCFATSQIFVVDGDLMQVEAVIATGRGPNDLVFAPIAGPGRGHAYLANFGENTIGVIDLDPTSPTYRFLVRRIGLPEPLR